MSGKDDLSMKIVKNQDVVKDYVFTELKNDGTVEQVLIVETNLAQSQFEKDFSSEKFGALTEAVREAMKTHSLLRARLIRPRGAG